MELIGAFIVVIVGLLGAAASNQIADEYKAWTPRIVEWLIRRSIRCLPDNLKERYGEEWRSHINDTPGETGKLIAAIGFLVASRKIVVAEESHEEDLSGAGDRIPTEIQPIPLTSRSKESSKRKKKVSYRPLHITYSIRVVKYIANSIDRKDGEEIKNFMLDLSNGRKRLLKKYAVNKCNGYILPVGNCFLYLKQYKQYGTNTFCLIGIKISGGDWVI